MVQIFTHFCLIKQLKKEDTPKCDVQGALNRFLVVFFWCHTEMFYIKIFLLQKAIQNNLALCEKLITLFV